MKIKHFVKRMLLRERSSSDDFISFLRKKGVEIGEDCEIFVPTKTIIDYQNPWMLKIGNHVKITEGVKILTHDYSWSVLKRYKSVDIPEGRILGAVGSVEIGDNVFIGMNAIIMRNVKIGSNVIIGAGSIVTKDCPSAAVYAGNPAHRIMSIEEFYLKREKQQLQEAKSIARMYKKRFREMPPKEIFNEYFMLFETGNSAVMTTAFNSQVALCGNEKKTRELMNAQKPMFEDYDAFISYCFEADE